MKYIKLFEKYKNYKGTILYHGTNKAHSIENSHFFSINEEFALDYGKIIYKVELLSDNIFDSSLKENIKLLYDKGFYLTDETISNAYDDDIEDAQEEFPTFNYKMNRFDTYEDYINNPYADETWDAIENSEGVMGWISSNYDACIIIEDGITNYLVFQPQKNCKILDIYKSNENTHENDIRIEPRLNKKNMWD